VDEDDLWTPVLRVKSRPYMAADSGPSPLRAGIHHWSHGLRMEWWRVEEPANQEEKSLVPERLCGRNYVRKCSIGR
jgi:hypothetical protein